MKPINSSLKPYSLSRAEKKFTPNRETPNASISTSKSPDKKVKLFAIKSDKLATLLRLKVGDRPVIEQTPKQEVAPSNSPFRDILTYDLYTNQGYRSVNLLDPPRIFMHPASTTRRRRDYTPNENNLSGMPYQFPVNEKPRKKTLGDTQELFNEKLNKIVALKQNNYYIPSNLTPVHDNNHINFNSAAPMARTIHSTHQHFSLPKLHVHATMIKKKKVELSELIISKDDAKEAKENKDVKDFKISGSNLKLPPTRERKSSTKFRLNIDLSMQ